MHEARAIVCLHARGSHGGHWHQRRGGSTQDLSALQHVSTLARDGPVNRRSVDTLMRWLSVRDAEGLAALQTRSRRLRPSPEACARSRGCAASIDHGAARSTSTSSQHAGRHHANISCPMNCHTARPAGIVRTTLVPFVLVRRARERWYSGPLLSWTERPTARTRYEVGNNRYARTMRA